MTRPLQRPPSTTTVAWVDPPAEHGDLAALISSGTLPLVAPSEPDRKERWLKVLSWYGRPEASWEAPSARATAMTGSDIVVALDSSVVALAELFADTVGRTCVDLSTRPALDAVATGEGSVLFIGLPASFTLSRMRALGEAMHRPWGFLTGRDFAGLTFSLAKALALRTGTSSPSAVVDLSTGSALVGRNGDGLTAQEGLPIEGFGPFAADGEWDVLAVAGHGALGHLNLRSVVLCGLLGRDEVDGDGRPVGGCRTVEGNRRCRRVHDEATRVIGFGDLRARTLCLCTCACFSVDSPELGTNVGTVLSAAEGYPAATLGADRLLSLHPWEPRVLVELLREGYGCGAAVKLLNDLRAERTGARPYFLHGDPAGPEPRASTPTVDGGVQLEAGAAVVPIRLRSPAGVVSLTPKKPSMRILASGAEHALLARVDDLSAERVAIRDVTEAIVELERWSAEAGRRLQGRAWSILAAERVGERLSTSVSEAPLAEVKTAERSARSGVQEILELCQRVRDLGAREFEDLERSRTQASLAIQECDRAFLQMLLTLADRTGSDDGMARNVLASGLLRQGSHDAGLCLHCGCELIDDVLVDPTGLQPTHHRHRCGLCGDLELWCDGRWRLAAQVPAPLRAGQQQMLTVSMAAEDSLQAGGWLNVDLVDKARGELVLSETIPVSAETTELKLRLATPADLSADLHVLSLVLVRDVSVAVKRLRWRGIRG